MVLAVAIGFVAFMLIGSMLLGKRGHRPAAKDIAYECGMNPIGAGVSRMSVKFYLVAMLFILFDIEVVFMYPWAVVYREMLGTHGGVIFGAMLSFIGVLFAGYLYAVKKHAFDWNR